MINITVHLSPTSKGFDERQKQYLVVEDGKQNNLTDFSDGIIEIPEDYYLDIDILYKNSISLEKQQHAPIAIINDEKFYAKEEDSYIEYEEIISNNNEVIDVLNDENTDSLEADILENNSDVHTDENIIGENAKTDSEMLGDELSDNVSDDESNEEVSDDIEKEPEVYKVIRSKETLWKIELWKSSSHAGRPFYGLAGRHIITIYPFGDFDESKAITIHVEVLANKDRALSIKNMLSEIDENYDEIASMCLDSNFDSNSSIMDLITNASDIVDWCSEHWNTLLQHIRKNYAPDMQIRQNGVANSAESIYWLSSYPEALNYCRPEEMDFKFNNIPIKAEYSAEEIVVPKFNLFENKVIAGFLNHIQIKLSDIRKSIISNKQRIDKGSVVFPDYVRYKQIVEEFNIDTQNSQENKLNKLLDKLHNLYTSFSKLTGLKGVKKILPPKITPFVARNVFYRELFVRINQWYNNCTSVIMSNDFAMHFIKIDKLYEFMVLARLVNCINDLGGHNLAMEWHNMSVHSFGGEVSERPKNEPYNYYKWGSANKDYTLELWYEPKIYTVNRANEGDLIVVRSDNYHEGYSLTPDFVFKVTWQQSGLVDYFIMDAKYSSDNTVINKSLPSLLNKYLYSINVKSKLSFGNPIRAVWALYSRGSREEVSSYASKHNLYAEYRVFPSIEGIQVSADHSKNSRKRDTEKDQNLKMAIETLIKSLRTMHQEYAKAHIIE